MGTTKRYDVSGMDQGGGRPYPEGTFLKLDRAHAERMGLEKPSRSAEPDSGDGDDQAQAKPRRAAGTRKRSAPKPGE